jgi:hypothetical protein
MMAYLLYLSNSPGVGYSLGFPGNRIVLHNPIPDIYRKHQWLVVSYV